jgi:hypothetical protein
MSRENQGEPTNQLGTERDGRKRSTRFIGVLVDRKGSADSV